MQLNLLDRFQKAWLPIYLVPLFVLGPVVAFFDAFAYKMFQTLENPAEVYTTIVADYMTLFHGLVGLSVLGMSSVVYYYRNLGDAAAFFVFTLSVVYSGLWDLIYYQF